MVSYSVNLEEDLDNDIKKLVDIIPIRLSKAQLLRMLSAYMCNELLGTTYSTSLIDSLKGKINASKTI